MKSAHQDLGGGGLVAREDVWRRAQNVFLDVLEVDAAARPSWIARACGDDKSLADAVDALLGGHETSGAVDELTPEDGALVAFQQQLREMAPATTPALGKVVGPFEIIGELGKGGMATVYRARRATDAFRQEVALKVLGPHRLSDKTKARFVFERQIAASLDHPNIAKLIDGGVTDDGRPYFALELVEGRPIDVYCDEQRLSVAARVRLVAEVAHAVHYAHRNLLVHRDLKPSNILVEAGGRVRLLDFGIAKALDPQTAGSAETQTGAVLLTPRYASPEQFTSGTITTAADQYQLGLLLFELVTGHCHHLLEGEDFASIGRRITVADTPRPSRVLSMTTTVYAAAAQERSLEEIAAARRTSVRELTRQLHGDLDTIILKALEKDPERRYRSVEAFADDLSRYLADQPVRARPSSLGYRLGKLVRRQRLAVAAAGLGLTALIAGAAVATWQAVRATESEHAALEQAATAEQVSEFLVNLFEVTDPDANAGRRLTAEEILERGREQLAGRLEEQPEVRGRLLRTVSQIYHNLGDLDTAVALAREALALHEDAQGPSSPEVADTLMRLSGSLRQQGAYAEAGSLAQRSLEIRQPIFGRRSLEVAECLARLGVIANLRGDGGKAEALHGEALAIRRQLLDEVSAPVGLSYYMAGVTANQNGRYEEAASWLERATEIERQVHGEVSIRHAEDLYALSNVYSSLGRFPAAERMVRESIRIAEEVYGPDHFRAIRPLEHLAELLVLTSEEYREAESLARRSLASKRARYGERSDEAGRSLANLGGLLSDMGRFEEAEPVFAEALAIVGERVGESHPRAAYLRNNLGEIYLEQGRLDEAEAGFQRALADLTAALPPGHDGLSRPRLGLGLVRWRQGRLSEAEAELEQARSLVEAAFGRDHVDLAPSLHALANVARDRGAHGEAETLYRRALELRSMVSKWHLDYRRTIEDFAALLDRMERGAEAAELRATLPAS